MTVDSHSEELATIAATVLTFCIEDAQNVLAICAQLAAVDAVAQRLLHKVMTLPQSTCEPQANLHHRCTPESVQAGTGDQRSGMCAGRINGTASNSLLTKVKGITDDVADNGRSLGGLNQANALDADHIHVVVQLAHNLSSSHMRGKGCQCFILPDTMSC